jgi:enoyl-CoA hydratase/carnithine racemase
MFIAAVFPINERMMGMKRVKYSVTNGIGKLVLNRPNIHNPLDYQTVLEIEQVLQRAQEDNIRVLIIKGEGGSFSAGADLKYLLSIISDKEQVRRFIGQINSAFNSIENARFPVIAMVKGYALAGGFEMMLACDIVVAADDAVIGDQHANFGLIPGGGGTQRLSRLVGKQKAKELLFSGRWLNGKDAEEAGLVFKSVPIQFLEGTVSELAARLNEKSRNGVSLMKYLVNQTSEMGLYEGIDLEVKLFNEYIHTSDPLEGLTAFVNKRPSIFKD